MHIVKLVLSVSVSSVIILSCASSNSRQGGAAGVISADSVVVQGAPTAEASSAGARTIVKHADLAIRADNVFAAAERLEQMVRQAGGVVAESTLKNDAEEVRTSYYKPDSLRQSQVYTTTATLTLRVPEAGYDSIVNAIPGLANFIDSRRLAQDDMTIAYAANELKANVRAHGAETDKALSLAKKTNDAIAAGQYADAKREQQDDRKIAQWQLMDNVRYATINVSLSQPQRLYVHTVVNTSYVPAPPFFTRAALALGSGWGAITEICIGLLSVWPILLAGGAGWIIYKKLRDARRYKAGVSL